jgi:hypothetical protein
MGANKKWFSCAKKQRVEQIRTKARSETSELTTSRAKSSAKQQHATGGLSSLKWYEGIVWLFPRSFETSTVVRMRQSFRKMSSRQFMGLQPPSVKMCEKRRNHTIFLSFNEITWSYREWRGAKPAVPARQGPRTLESQLSVPQLPLTGMTGPILASGGQGRLPSSFSRDPHLALVE